MDWGVKAQHIVLMPDGDVLYFDISSSVRVWDPDSLSIENANLDALEFISCAGHVVLADGRILVISGTYGFLVGAPPTFFFDPATRTWSRGPSLHDGRYYPGAVTLPDGRVVVMSGDVVTETVPSSKVEVLTPGPGEAWSVIGETPALYESYPQLFARPDGRIVRTGPEAQALVFDPDSGAWEFGPSMAAGDRNHGTAAWLPDGSGAIALGGKDEGVNLGFPSPPTGVETLSFEPGAEWVQRASMSRARVDINAVLLADGTLLAVGGHDGDGHPEYGAELYDSAADLWTTMAPMQRSRMYHSTALLLPDGRVLAAGGDDEKPGAGEPEHTAEIYSPPYLFRGDRPVIDAAPSEAGFGNQIDVETADAPDVAKVTLVRLGSVTHSLSFDQRLVEADFEVIGEDTVRLTTPTAAEAPPGWYMLFLLSSNGVPSEAALLVLRT